MEWQQRKIVRQGKSALTITLPSKWTKKFSLDDTNSIYIKEEENNLIIKSNSSSKLKKTKIDVTDKKKGLTFHIINGLYLQGFDEIEITHNNLQIAKELSTGYIGMIPKELTSSKLILKSIIKEPEDNFLDLFKISTQQLIDLARSLETESFEDTKLKERVLDRNLIYSLRYITKYEKIEDKYKYFLICSTIENAADNISEIAKYKKTNNVSKKQIEKIVEIIEYYVVYIHQNNIEKIHTHLRKHKENNPKKDFVDALTLSISENLYNFIGLLK